MLGLHTKVLEERAADCAKQQVLKGCLLSPLWSSMMTADESLEVAVSLA